ncbi:hypothetical protein RHMOL_Rhmol06G0324500 [Rhododendron molle]|uniref:Uncharacterized protein n=1 Tax=Rhododendron molle TaxID=49168 RepID=A0ACC0NJL6_RHOML|nr:hypothetical protein RHMOL_Rhmol06G0324500 [Rhododendron molle]
MGRGRAPCCDKSKVNKGPWSPAEDLRLITFIRNHGHGNWRHLPKQAGLLRCGKSCRLRWINYLSPDVKRGNFSKEEEETIIKLHHSLGNKWSKIASHLPGRTDNEIKNVWNTHLKKRSIFGRKDANGHKDDQTKELSIISSQSCSSTTDEEQKDASSSSSISSYASNDSNSNQVDVSMPNEDPNSLLDFPGPGYHEIDKAAATYEGNNQSVISDDLVMFEIPLEPDIDLWGMLDNLDPFQYSDDSLPLDFEASHSSNVRDVESDDTEIDQCSKWLKYLENELGLADATSDGGLHHNPDPSKDAAGELGSETILGPENDPDCYFPLWPSSPQKFWDLIS